MEEGKPRPEVRGDDLVDMTRLLRDTRAPEWQDALKKLLMTYYQHDVMKQAVMFLMDNIHRATEAIENPDLYPGFPCLYIHTDNKPVIFDLDYWKAILIALNFEITEPEGNRHLDLIEVKVTDNVTVPSLLGFHKLLSSITNLSWENLRLVLYMGETEPLLFLDVLQRLLQGPDVVMCDDSLVNSLYERQREAMESLGFHRRRGEGRGVRKQVWWRRVDSDQLDCLIAVLFGLFHHGRGLETYI